MLSKSGFRRSPWLICDAKAHYRIRYRIRMLRDGLTAPEMAASCPRAVELPLFGLAHFDYDFRFAPLAWIWTGPLKWHSRELIDFRVDNEPR